MKKFNEVFKELRLERGLSQDELAKILDVSKSALCSWETGYRVPSRYKQQKICDYFNVDLNYLNGLTPIRSLYRVSANVVHLPIYRKINSEDDFTDKNILEMVSLPDFFLEEGCDFFAYIMMDNSLSGSSIYEGDILVFKRCTSMALTKICYLVIDDKVYIRKLFMQEKLSLLPTNDQFSPIEIDKEPTILGTLVTVISRR